MARQVVALTLDTLDELPNRCRRCVFWELDPLARARAEEAGDTAFEKEAWLSATLLEWGPCGLLARVDGVTAGYLLFAPPALVPGSQGFPTSPAGADAVLLMTMTVVERFAGQGIARLLMQALIRELLQRGVRAVEAFGDLAHPGSGEAAAARVDRTCLLPASFLLAVGFTTVRPHHRFPRLRLELKSVATWREEVEVALERLITSVRPDPALRPV